MAAIGQSAAVVAGSTTAAATMTESDLSWKKVLVAVAVGSFTAVLTQLTLDYVRSRKGKKVKSPLLTFSDE